MATIHHINATLTVLSWDTVYTLLQCENMQSSLSSHPQTLLLYVLRVHLCQGYTMWSSAAWAGVTVADILKAVDQSSEGTF